MVKNIYVQFQQLCFYQPCYIQQMRTCCEITGLFMLIIVENSYSCLFSYTRTKTHVFLDTSNYYKL